MRPTRSRIPLVAAIMAICLFAGSCAALGNVAAALANLQRLKFKIGSIHAFRLLEIGRAHV
jgi:hypothetical protein